MKILDFPAFFSVLPHGNGGPDSPAWAFWIFFPLLAVYFIFLIWRKMR
jgi:hypothetical protein